MLFSDRLKIVEEYKQWLNSINNNNEFTIKDSYETFLAFLEINGYLKEKEEIKPIIVGIKKGV